MGAIAGILPLAGDAGGAGRDGLISALGSMRAAMTARAPTPGGMAVAYDGSIALAHGASVGPGSESVLQPLVDERGTLWLVADGEPSNAAALRLELIGAGHQFRSACGSEVILHLYEHDGVAALDRLAGSFAFALWDRERHELILGRDRFGAKPLYVAVRPDRVAFASEVRALAGGAGLDPAALGAFLALGYVPEPLTVAGEVRAVDPGSVVRVRGGHARSERFWEEAAALPSGDRGADDAQLGWLVREAVEAAVAGEEDVGVLLGDGIAGAALLALVRPMLGRGLRTHAFTFGAARVDGGPGTGRWRGLLARRAPGRDQSVRAARGLADWFGAEHHEHVIEPRLVGEALEVAARGDQPSIGAPLTRLAVMALRARGGRVWLSSLAVPGLLGSPRAGTVSWLWRIGHYGSARRLARAGSRAASHVRPFGRAATIADYLDRRDSVAAAYLAAGGLLAPSALAAVLRPEVAAAARAGFDAIAHLDGCVLHPPGPPCVVPPRSSQAALARALAIVELAGPLMSGALRDAESAAVAHGVALRIPLLDHRVFEWLVTGGAADEGVPLLRVVGALPRPAERPGQALPPLDAWMRATLRPHVEARLLADDPDGLFARAGVEALWHGFLTGRVDWRRVWSLAVLRAWISERRARTRVPAAGLDERSRGRAAA